MFERYLPATPAATSLAILAVAGAAIGGAWIFQALGFHPCDLCYQQRYAYYAGMPLALLIAALTRASTPSLVLRIGLAALALMFAANVALAIYHSGVEMKLWPGPTACAGSAVNGPANAADLLAQLQSVKVVRCDEVALRIFGLSLANWNVLISAALAALGARAAWRAG
ncbi:MAG: disulfide bond formation protein B [Roseiarcus sp.]